MKRTIKKEERKSKKGRFCLLLSRSFQVFFLLSLFSFLLYTACDLLSNEDKDEIPSIDDFIINGIETFTYDGTAKIVTVTAIEGKTTGDITVKYNEDTTPPSTVGEYLVTFDVTASKGWKELNNAIAGTLVIGNATPAINDFDFSGTGTFDFDGDYKIVSVTSKAGKTTGDITVYYTGEDEEEYPKSDEAPVYIGKYYVTFDVAPAEGWNETSNLSVGIIEIVDGTPPVPTGLKAVVESSDSIKVSWSSVSKATSYNVYYITEEDDEIALAGTAETITYTHTDLTEDSVYWYYVTAVNQYGESDYSDYKAIAICKPDAPAVVEATATSSGTVNVRWSSVSEATSYKVFYNTTGSEGTKSSYTNNTYTSTSCSLQGLKGNTTYYFFVKAVNGLGESDYSEAGSAKTYPGGDINAGLTAEWWQTGVVRLSWNIRSSTNYWFNVYYSTTPDGKPTLLKYKQLTNTYFHDTAKPNTTYYYWITYEQNTANYWGTIESGFSEVAVLRTGTPVPPQPLPPNTPIYTSTPPSNGNKGSMLCLTCSGSGKCPQRTIAFGSCKGGYNDKTGNKCGVCNGSGICWKCKGKGRI